MSRLRLPLMPAAVSFAALGAWRPIASPDAFWHLAAGRWMLEHGRIPRHDPFRFTSEGETWVDHEWGFQLLAGGSEAAAGIVGVVALRAAIFALLAWLLWRLGHSVAARSVAAERAPWLDGALGFGLWVTLAGLHGRMPLRPELLTLVFFAALLWLLESARRAHTKAIWFTVPLVALWVNAHPGALLAPGIVFLHLAGRRLRPGEGESRPGWDSVLGLPAAAFAALACNPWGLRVAALPFRIRAALADLPASNPDWRRLWDDPPVMLLGVLVVLGIVASRFRNRRIDLASALVLASATVLMFAAVRFQGLVWIAAFAFFGHLLDRGETLERDRPFGRRPAAVVLVLLVLGCGVEGWRASTVDAGIEPGRFPAASVAALESWDRDASAESVGPLFNSAVFGGYILYRTFPPRQVFVDTRNEVDPSILRQIADARSDARAWRALVDHYELDAALLRYEDRPRRVLGPPATPGGQPTVEIHTTSALLFPQKDWALVHWDDVSMLFLRRTEERAAALAEAEYRYVQPEDVQARLRHAARTPSFRAGMEREVHRKLSEDPESRRAHAMLEALRPRTGTDTMP